MSLLDKLKSVLGMSSGQDGDASRSASSTARDGGGVTVERERSANTETEDAVKGTDTGEGDASAPTGAKTDASGETSAAAGGEMVDTDAGVEPAEVVGSADTDTGPVDEPGEATGPTTDDEGDEGDEGDEDELGTSESTTVIKGIGPSYADTLAAAGVETVADLAAADPESLSSETDISEKRLERWIGRAQHR